MVRIDAKEKFSHIYNRASHITLAQRPFWPAMASPDKHQDTITGYVMAILDRYFNIPFLIPYQGILNRDKSEVNSFLKYVALPAPYNNFSPEQRLLNSYYQDLEQLRLSEAISEGEMDEEAYSALKERNRALALRTGNNCFPC